MGLLRIDRTDSRSRRYLHRLVHGAPTNVVIYAFADSILAALI
jgi:hypothetical protein